MPDTVQRVDYFYVQARNKPGEGARYLAYVRASQLNRCRYCVTHNGAAARRVGVSREQLDAHADFQTSPLFSELERLILRYAEEMTTRVQVDPALVETLKAHLDPEALVQLTLTVAAANFTNRFNEALGTELEFEEAGHG